jgi:2-haloacid dehalogenase
VNDKSRRAHKEYTFLLWDVDHTLLDFKKSESYALKKSFSCFGREIDDDTVELYSQINDMHWKRYELGEINKTEVLYGRFRELLRVLGIKDISLDALEEMYQEELGNVYYYLDDSYQLCKELKKQYKQYVISNGVGSTQNHKLELSGFSSIMDGIFISEEVGSPKPEKAFFDVCFKSIPDFDKAKALVIGDSLSSDIRGANNAGVDACWYHAPGATSAGYSDVTYQYEITNLWQLKDILG